MAATTVVPKIVARRKSVNHLIQDCSRVCFCKWPKITLDILGHLGERRLLVVVNYNHEQVTITL